LARVVGSQLNSRSHGYGWADEAPNQPDDERNERSQKHEGQAENKKKPQRSAPTEGGDITAHGSPGIAADAPAKHGQGLDVRAAIEAYISAEDCRIASDNGVALHHHAPAESRDIAIDAASNPNATIEAGHLRDMLITSDGDVMTELSSVV
jgi:hypothetical protein